MRLSLAASLITLLSPAWVLAADVTPRQSFDKINNCVKIGNIANCRELVTASSVPIFDRFSSHNLVRCLPKDAAYVSGKTTGSFTTIRASTGVAPNKRYMRIVLAEEEGEWKLDIPESLRIGMGENWEKQLNISEQIYTMMKTQLKTDLNCEAIQSLVRPKQ